MNSFITLIFSITLLGPQTVNKTAKNMQSSTIYDIEINSLEGTPIDLNSYKGKKILFVNVASECGFTGQYEGLQKLHEAYKNELVIIGVPCNQFGSQEPGSSQEIASFCKLNYGVSFTMTEKTQVKGKEIHPLYSWLTNKELNGVKNTSVKWNFQKYLIDEEGTVFHESVNVEPVGRNVAEYLRMIDAYAHFQKHGEVCPANWEEGKEAILESRDSVAAYLAKRLN